MAPAKFFHSLFDTTTSSGKLLFQIMGALATFERDLIRERTGAGLAAARAAGRIGGRRRLITSEMNETVQTLAANPKLTKPMIAAKLEFSVPTLSRALSSASPYASGQGRLGRSLRTPSAHPHKMQRHAVQ